MLLLSAEQKAAVNRIVRTTRHTCLYGAAGTGKSAETRALSRRLPGCLVLGTTGASIVGVPGAMTLALYCYHERRKRRTPVKTVILEEAGMLTAEMATLLDESLRKSHNAASIMGGVRLIMIGDVLQLPPVADNGAFFFQSALHGELDPAVIVLHQQHRHAPCLQPLVAALRAGALDKGHIAALTVDLASDVPCEGEVVLCATNRACEAPNAAALAAHGGDPAVVGTAQWKLGARVCATRNCYENRRLRVANGTLGVLAEGGAKTAKILPDNARKPVSVPADTLALAWAITIHKAQGKTFAAVAIDGTAPIRMPQMLYVAVSRAKTLRGVRTTNMKSVATPARSAVLAAYVKAHGL